VNELHSFAPYSYRERIIQTMDNGGIAWSWLGLS
jgi:hypothetical protein